MNHVPFDQVCRLAALVLAMAQRMRLEFREAVDRVESALELQMAREANVRDQRATARALLRTRSRRTQLLGVNLFRDPAWDILLDLYANCPDEGTMVSSLCHVANVPPTTALRYVHKLAETGSLVCEEHPDDQRRTMVRLAPHMPERIEQLLGTLRIAG